MLIGRKTELKHLQKAYESDYSEFVVVYGRRRVGKTFLVLEAFDYNFTFMHTGMANTNLKNQLAAWKSSLKDSGLNSAITPKNWIDAFDQLKILIKQSSAAKKVIFIDEMPWMDTKRSNFVPTLEHFWNGWAVARKDIVLIVCGSSTSWIINKVIKNKGGLHNRVTCRIKLKPFTLGECQEYANVKKLGMVQKQILDCYMILGGIPFYWAQYDRNLGLAQNIDNLFFQEDAILQNEYEVLYSSLFNGQQIYMDVVKVLGQKKVGMTRAEIVNEGNIVENGKLTRVLNDLEYCGFIRSYNKIGHIKKGTLYQLIDFYTLFYFKFIVNNRRGDSHFWTMSIGTNMYNTWRGLAFERVCLLHIEQIKRALDIGGVLSSEETWYSDRNTSGRGAQIDLLIDRNDDIVDICEMKYYNEDVVIDEQEELKLENRRIRFREETGTKKAVHIILVTVQGLKRNSYSDIFQNVVTMPQLFE